MAQAQLERLAASDDRDARLCVPPEHQMADVAAYVNSILDQRDEEIAQLRQQLDQKITAHEDDLTTNAFLRQTKELLRQRSQALDAALKSAAASNEAKSTFLANVSHELRTPMNGVIGMAELLLRTDLNEHQAKLAKTIVESGRALVVIINDILDFSKIEAGKIELRPAPFNFRSCVDDVMLLMEVQAASKSIILKCWFDEHLPQMVVGDAGRIRQILTNLIGNAVKFTEQGSVQVRVESKVSGDHANLDIEIIDTGPGIAKAAAAEIFEKFSQVDSTSTRHHEGTGLGLAICKLLVEQMGGDIDVASELGVGSTFHFSMRLPIATDSQAVSADASALVGKRIGVLGPNSANSSDLVMALTNAGSEVRAVEQLEDVQCSGCDFDLVVLVCQDVDTDGLQRVKSFKRQNYGFDRPIIVSTEVGAIGDGASLGIAGVQGYMTADTPSETRCEIISTALTSHGSGHHELVTKYSTVAALPVVEHEPPRTMASPQLEHSYKNPAPEERTPCHVLVVDDGVVNRTVATEFLEFMGCTVATAANGREAVDCIEHESYDLVLMDCQMPEMDGLEATKHIRRRENEQGRSRLPVIALTANAFNSDRDRCLDAGMDEFLVKPLDPDLLEAVVAKFKPLPSRAAGA